MPALIDNEEGREGVTSCKKIGKNVFVVLLELVRCLCTSQGMQENPEMGM